MRYDFEQENEFRIKASDTCAVIYLFDNSFMVFTEALVKLGLTEIGKKKIMFTSSVQKKDCLEIIIVFEF